MNQSQLFPILSLHPSHAQFPASLRLIPDLRLFCICRVFRFNPTKDQSR